MQPQAATSPLRYPGGKQKLHPLVRLIIQKSGLEHCTYVEPFAGGAGVALALLFENAVDSIVINDFDRAISSFWKAVLSEPDRFAECILSVPLTIEEWKKQREIYDSATRYSFEYGFASFFLNRTNHSGILKGGPIGGFGQKNSKYNVSARFNRQSLAAKITAIKSKKDSIRCYNQDVLAFLRNQVPRLGPNVFIYFDPPYYNNGRRLYENYFQHRHHQSLAETIRATVDVPWIVSYDNVPQIREMYSGLTERTFSLSYSLANNGTGQEVMFFRDAALCPTDEELQAANVEMPNWR
jgi:DNA adenine methylase